MDEQRKQIKVAVKPDLETRLKELAEKENRYLSNLCEALLITALKIRAWRTDKWT